MMGAPQPRGWVLFVGATSGIARAVASEFARRGHNLVLTGRDCDELARISADLGVRYGIISECRHLDVLAIPTHATVVDGIFALDAPMEGAVICAGYLGDQRAAETNWAEAERILHTNFTGCVSIIDNLANRFEKLGRGFICVLSSVAGDRGRQSNYLYGAAKGGLSVYLQGIRNRLFHKGVRVITIKPGFVNTSMTYGRPGLFLVASPEAVARQIYRATQSGADVIYVPRFWRWIMAAIRAIPEPIFKRLKL